MAAANPRTVVVLSNGGVLATGRGTAGVPAILEGWLLGQAGGSAIADVLFGLVNPSGRLAETIPLKLADHPSYLDFPGENGHVRYGEGIHVGYRGFDAREQEVAYPFGFGLSYTTFEYGQPARSSPSTASRCGYRSPTPAPRRPRGRPGLREPARLGRAPLAPRAQGVRQRRHRGRQDRRGVLSIDRADLAYWETRLGRWVVEGGEYHCAVGASSRDLRCAAVVKVPGDNARIPLTADSTVAEWLADPRGAQLLAEAFGPAGPTAVPARSRACSPTRA